MSDTFRVTPAADEAGLRIQVNALVTMVRSLQAQLDFYRKAYKTAEGWRQELESQRQANALLTEELERMTALRLAP